MLLLKSFILGFSVSAPVGPIGLLCIQRILSRGKLAGFMTGVGASSANLIYASLAAFGFSAASSFLIEQQLLIRMISGLFLFYLGVKTFFIKPSNTAANVEGESLYAMYFSTFFLMITNPLTIVNFVGMFAGLGYDQSSSSGVVAFSLIIGVFLGAITWWVTLSFIVSILRTKIRPHLGIVNKLAGILIIVLSILPFFK